MSIRPSILWRRHMAAMRMIRVYRFDERERWMILAAVVGFEP